MSRFNFWPNRRSSGLIEQDVELTVVSFEDVPLDALNVSEGLDTSNLYPTSLEVCRWCNGPASPTLDDCCVRCLEKLKRRAAIREKTAPNNSRIDF